MSDHRRVEWRYGHRLDDWRKNEVADRLGISRSTPLPDEFVAEQLRKNEELSRRVLAHHEECKAKAKEEAMYIEKGDKVLVEAVVYNPANINGCRVVDIRNDFGQDDRVILNGRDQLHIHPGVPVAALVKELKERDALWDGKYRTDPNARRNAEGLVSQLRTAREAAGEPKLEAGRGVWARVRVRVSDVPEGRVAVESIDDIGGSAIDVDRDDIRTEEQWSAAQST